MDAEGKASEAARMVEAWAADLPNDLRDVDEEQIEVLRVLQRYVVRSLDGKQDLRGARLVAEAWLTVIEHENARRHYRAVTEAAQLERLFALKTE